MKDKENLATELEQLKKTHGKVITLEVPLDEDDDTKKAVLYLKKPDMSTRSMVAKLVQNDSYKAIVACLKKLRIGGDDLELVLRNDDAVASCESAIVELLTVQQATIKKN